MMAWFLMRFITLFWRHLPEFVRSTPPITRVRPAFGEGMRTIRYPLHSPAIDVAVYSVRSVKCELDSTAVADRC